MGEPFFISKSVALAIHDQQIERFGGALGIRDEFLLDSALGAARQTWHYSRDLYQTAAQYCYSLANNHPFVDGNKRVAAACMLVFLLANHCALSINNTQLYAWVIDVATGTVNREQLANLLREHCRQTGSDF